MSTATDNKPQTNSAASRFEAALHSVLHELRDDDGIGTLSERTVHAVLKRCYEPYSGSREVKLGRYVADICGEDGIIEIQTGGFDKLRGKLEAFLAVGRVTVVYPVAHKKRLCWLDPETGERSAFSKSPKTGTPAEVFAELWKIKNLLENPNFALRVVLLDLDEYRILNPKMRNKKMRSRRDDRIPTAFADEIVIERVEDYVRLCPDGLGETFTSLDFSKKAKISRHWAQTALQMLTELGVVERLSKDKSGYHYSFKW